MIRKHIPNILTICNLLCGSLAVFIACSGLFPLEYATYLILIGALFDFSDGFAARLLHAYSPMGKQLDSLADLITFGFAPTAIIIAILQHIIWGSSISETTELQTFESVFLIIPLIITALSAVRLAKFNIDTRQSDSFLGLPTPANGLFLSGLVFHDTLVFGPYFIIGASIFLSFLLISEIPMFSLKIKSLSFSTYPIQMLFILISIILVILFKLQAISLIIGLYIITCIILSIFSKQKKRV